MPGGRLHAAQTMQPSLRDGEAPSSAALAADFGSGWLQIWALNILPLKHWHRTDVSEEHWLLSCTTHGRMTLQHVHIYLYLSVYTHVYVFVHVFLQGEAWPFCSPQVAHPWSAFRSCCCALTQKLTHHQEGQAYTSPPLRSASALQMRRQTGNESCCALVNELIALRHHCQFCFCSAWSQYLSESGCNFRVAARAFQEDVFLDKSKVLEYASTQLGFSLSLSFFNSVFDILWTFFFSLLNGCQWGTDTFFSSLQMKSSEFTKSKKCESPAQFQWCCRRTGL